MALFYRYLIDSMIESKAFIFLSVNSEDYAGIMHNYYKFFFLAEKLLKDDPELIYK